MASRRLNNMWIGLALGIFLPFIAFVIYYLVRYSHLSLGEFIQVYFNLGLLTPVMSLSVIPNLLLFFGFIRKNWLYGARGVLFATILFAITVAVFRFI